MQHFGSRLKARGFQPDFRNILAQGSSYVERDSYTMHNAPNTRAMPELLPPASVRAELRRQRQAIWQLTNQQSEMLSCIQTFMQVLGTDDEIFQRLGALGKSLELHRQLDQLKKGDAARHAQFRLEGEHITEGDKLNTEYGEQSTEVDKDNTEYGEQITDGDKLNMESGKHITEGDKLNLENGEQMTEGDQLNTECGEQITAGDKLNTENGEISQRATR